MKQLHEMLKNPFGGLVKGNENEFQKECARIAHELLSSYCIKCNDREYYFAEIEIYYYEEDKWDDKWNEVTYERNGYQAGDLFYHLSGVDVCFESDLKKDKGIFSGKGGGILIRAMIDSKATNDQNALIVGPLTCKDKMLNACKGGKMPKLMICANKRIVETNPAYRFLGKDDFEKIETSSNEQHLNNKDGNLKLAFYDSSIKPEDWNLARSSYYVNRFKHELR